MNTLRPDLIWLEGRCYRLNESGADSSCHYEQDTYICEPTANDIDSSEEECEITMENQRYRTSFHVPKAYFGSIIGKKGSIKMKLENESGSQIIIPKPGEEGDVVVIATTENGVKIAKHRITTIAKATRLRMDPTHFVSIPCNSTEIIENFNIFKNRVLTECKENSGLDESIFILPSKLHITIGVMTITDQVEREEAVKLFEEIGERIIQPRLAAHHPFRIRLRGLSYMNDEPKRVNVLYSNVEEDSGALQELCDEIFSAFLTKGLMKSDHGRDFVKIHVTMMNSRYRGKSQLVGSDSESVSGGEKLFNRRTPFDATKILEKFGNYDFGVSAVSKVHLSQMHVLNEDGYYMPTAVISCEPENV